MPWGMPRHSMGGTIVTPVIIATALTRNLTACQGNPRATPTSTAPRVGVGLGFHGVPWRSVERSVVCRGQCSATGDRWWCHDMPRAVVKKYSSMHASFDVLSCLVRRGIIGGGRSCVLQARVLCLDNDRKWLVSTDCTTLGFKYDEGKCCLISSFTFL